MKQWLKQSGFLSSTLLFLGLLFCMQCSLGLVGKGAVRVPRTVDAGTHKAGEKVRCAIRMQNLTPLPISIFAEVGCSCSLVDHSNGMFIPCGSYTPNVEIDTTGFPLGEQHKAVKVKFLYSNRSWEELVDMKLIIQ